MLARDKHENANNLRFGVGWGGGAYRENIGSTADYYPDWRNGNHHSIFSESSGLALVIHAPTNFPGSNVRYGTEVTVAVEYVNNGTIELAEDIHQPQEWGWELPITIPGSGYRLHIFTLVYEANLWALKDVKGPFDESTD